MPYALIQSDLTWEYDFIKLVLGPKFIIVKFNPRHSLPHGQYRGCVFIFNKHLKYPEQHLERIKPSVVMYLSDEEGKVPYCVKWAKYCKLFLHAYNHKYNYPANSIQFPLGYVSGFISEPLAELQTSKIKQRKYIAGFVGERNKSDRATMLDNIKELGELTGMDTKIITSTNQWTIDSQKVKPSEVFEIYNEVIFVPIGRGNYSLDCFRIYEAIVAGAIPIIVGSKNEIDLTFNYNGDLLPALYFDDWESAKHECAKLIKDLDSLQKQQDMLFKWFVNKVDELRYKIHNAVGIDGGSIHHEFDYINLGLIIVLFVLLLCVVLYYWSQFGWSNLEWIPNPSLFLRQ